MKNFQNIKYFHFKRIWR